jgi:hypothetical protein
VEKLNAELATLWDWADAAKKPLGIEGVHSETKNGYKVEGIYINAYKSAGGQDRIFFYYARPEKIEGKIPAYIELTGGGAPERSLWMARTYKCAVVDVEWRGLKNQFRSKWVDCNFDSMKSLTISLKDNPAFRLVTSIRRTIDFLQQQPEIDAQNIGCGGGSMGGYYTLLTAGVDDRVKFGLDELGAGHLGATDSRLGQFELTPEYKSLWLKAFDPYSYAGRTKAKIFMNLSAEDYFFWLGDGTAQYEAQFGEKRLCINPNFNHNEGPFGKKKHLALGWLDYAFGREHSFPEITEVRNNGSVYKIVASPEITSAVLCWSPGEKLNSSARYWSEVPAKKTANGWEAEIPATYAGLARNTFVTVSDAKGRMVSSVPTFTAGIDPVIEPGPLWSGNSLWDTASGIAAWRQIGANVRTGAPAKLELAADGHGLRISPGEDGKPDFSLVTNSAVLASGQAAKHQGLTLSVDAGGTPGNLKVILVRNFGAARDQQESASNVSYEAGKSMIELPWNQFVGRPDGSAFPFDGLRLEGARADGIPLEIQSIAFLK